MKVIIPTPLTDARLVSSSAPEADYPAYAASTTYALGARIMRIGTHRIYESLAPSNLGNTPETSPTKWLDIAPTNRWAMFDSVVGTATAQAGPLTVVIAPGSVNAIALLELVGSAVTVSMSSASAGGVVYSRTVSLDESVVTDYYEYFFEPFSPAYEVVLVDLPPYGDGVITVVLAGTGTVKLGVLTVGLTAELGDAQYGASAGIQSYSKKTIDDFGNTAVAKRGYSRRTSVNLWIPNDAVRRTHRKFIDLRDTPCVWVPAPDMPTLSLLTVYGFYGDFNILVQYATRSLCNLTIEGLI